MKPVIEQKEQSWQNGFETRCGGSTPANSQTPAQPLAPSPFPWDGDKIEGRQENLTSQ